MKRSVWALLLTASSLIIVLVALLASQAENQASRIQTNGPVTVKGLKYPLKLTVTVSETDLTLGEPLELTLSLENVGNETLTLYFSDGNDAYDYRIYNESDVCIYSYYYDTVYPMIHVPEQMKPGDVRNFTSSWDQKSELVYQPPNPPYYIKVPAGTYRINGAFICHAHALGFTVETPSITFRILE